MMASLELPHWLMIAGALLVVAGFIGILVSGKKADDVDPPPTEPTDTCAYRKSNPGILVVQSAQNRATKNASNCLGGT
jgi:hypothetical protein